MAAAYGTRSVEVYEKVKCVGSGTYGCVYEAKHKATGERVAMKKIKTLNEAEGIPITTLREIAALKALRHPNLVQLKEVVVSKQKDDNDDDLGGGGGAADDSAYSNHGTETGVDYASGSIYLVLEFVPHDLTGLLQSGHVFTEVAAKYIMKQLLEALQYMHLRDVVHRDIKCSNILLTADHEVKLADYGLARTARTNPKFTNKVVTLWYRAPELLLGANDYDGSIDMWSAGCVMAELFLGHPIFAGKVEADQMAKIIDVCGSAVEEVNGISHLPHYEKFIQPDKRTWQLKTMMNSKAEKRKRPLPKGFLELLDKLLQIDPKKRFNAEQALQSEYFRSHPHLQDPATVSTWIPTITSASCHEMSTRKAKKESGAQAILNAASKSKHQLAEKSRHPLEKKPRAAMPPAPPSATSLLISKLGIKKDTKSESSGLAKRSVKPSSETPAKARTVAMLEARRERMKKETMAKRSPAIKSSETADKTSSRREKMAADRSDRPQKKPKPSVPPSSLAAAVTDADRKKKHEIDVDRASKRQKVASPVVSPSDSSDFSS